VRNPALRRFRLKIAVKPVDQIKAINLAIGKRCAYSKLLRCSSSPCLRYGSSRTPRRMTNQDVLHRHNAAIKAPVSVAVSGTTCGQCLWPWWRLSSRVFVMAIVFRFNQLEARW
jgi:hypothetical protein